MTTPDRPVVVIADKLADSAVSALGDGFDVRSIDGTDVPTLHAALAEADAVIVRSATRIDAAALAAAAKLQVVARAGVGLDNVDIDTATERGVMVVNAPTSNIVSAAEQAVALLLATARHTAVADASLKNGEWKRSQFTGVELAGKTLGVVGLGRIGQLFAARMAAFDTKLLAYDPYVQPGRAAQMGVQLVSLDDLLMRSDFISIHLPKTPETLGLIGKTELDKVKPGVRIVNAARGGLIEEKALAEALADGRVAGAGIDVFTSEPCTDSPLFALDNVVVTPHLGASTREAQDNAGLAVVKSVKLALAGEFVPDAVNVKAGSGVAEDVRPLLPLAERLGRLFTAIANGPIQSVTVEVRGEVIESDVSVLQLAATKGLFVDVADQVTYVNAPLLAAEKGIDVGLFTSVDSPEFLNQVTVRGALADGRALSVSGTVTHGPKEVRKLIEIDGYDVEIDAEGPLMVLRYIDRPGIVGRIGRALGDEDINIASMQVSRREVGGEALMVVASDAEIPADMVSKVASTIGATAASSVLLAD